MENPNIRNVQHIPFETLTKERQSGGRAEDGGASIRVGRCDGLVVCSASVRSARHSSPAGEERSSRYICVTGDELLCRTLNYAKN